MNNALMPMHYANADLYRFNTHQLDRSSLDHFQLFINGSEMLAKN